MFHGIYRWVFLFDKVMLVCRKPRAVVFEQRYVVKQVYQVAQLRVEPMTHQSQQSRTKVESGWGWLAQLTYSTYTLTIGNVWAAYLRGRKSGH